MRKKKPMVGSTRHKAVFFDRDGTLIRFIENALKPSDMKLIPGVAKVLKAVKKKGFLCIMASNQPCIEKGLITRKKADALNVLLLKKLQKAGATLDAMYMCPHRYPSSCRCRKPKTGMIQTARRRFGIDLKKSYMVGDTRRDVQTGMNAGLTTILVRSGPEWNDRRFFDVEPDHIVTSLSRVIPIIK